MISAVVLALDSWPGTDLPRERELVARSMVWLVSAVVAGVVRDVTLAVPERLGLSVLADQAGCALIEAKTESDRLWKAVAGCREMRVMVLRAGFQPDPGLTDEVEAFTRAEPMEAAALLRSVPATFLQRMLPQIAPAVGAILPRSTQPVGDFDSFVRTMRRRAYVLHTRAQPIR